jgi:hypothetical protein
LTTRLFVVLCLGRTGSTHLVSMLGHHSQAVCLNEIFGDGKPPTFAAAATDDPEEFLREALGDGPERAKGLKLPINSIRLTPEAAEMVRSHREMAVVRLSRRNRLAQLVSRHLLAKTGVSQSIFGSYGDATVELDPAATLRALDRMDSEEAELDGLATGHETFRIDYEGLGDTGRLEELQAFLGLDPEPLQSWFERLRTRPLSETVSNWDELSATLAGTRHEPLLRAPD